MGRKDTELMPDAGQANELKLAFRRSGYTNADIKKFCEGKILARLLPEIRRKESPATITCEVFSGCRCNICGGFFADGDEVCASGHQIGQQYIK